MGQLQYQMKLQMRAALERLGLESHQLPFDLTLVSKSASSSSQLGVYTGPGNADLP